MLFKNKYIETKELFFRRCYVPISVYDDTARWLLLGVAWLVLDVPIVAIIWFALAVFSFFDNKRRLAFWESQYDTKECKEPEITVEFYEEYVVLSENNVEKAKFQYEYFSDLEEDKEFFRLVLHDEKHWESKKKPSIIILTDSTAEARTILIMKDKFEQGEAAEFKKFMKTKKSKGFSVH